MKVILSRKGFEPTHGGIPSPIMPDGTLLLLPKPKENGMICYHDLFFQGNSYYDIAVSLENNLQSTLVHARCDSGCYILPSSHTPPLEWLPAYVHTGPLESHLSNQHICVGDIFLFYGWFRQTEYDEQHKLRFVPDAKEQNIIFSYFQIGAIIKDIAFFRQQIKRPLLTFLDNRDVYPNTIYLPTKKLSYNNQQPGCATLSYSPKLVLTKPGYHYNQWQLPDFLCAPDVTITYHNNRNNGFLTGKDYFKASPISEEFVIHGTYDLKNWVHSLINTLELAATEEDERNTLHLIPHDNYPDQHSQIYCRRLHRVLDLSLIDCSGCLAAANSTTSNFVQCKWQDYVSINEGNLSVANPFEEYKRVNWLLEKRLLPEHLMV